MEQYIKKSALVAEIERRIKNLYPKGSQGMVVTKILKDHYEDLLFFLDSLEVREVDLEEEIERVRKTHFINDDFEKATLEGRQITNIAKHFFELGMQVGKPITAADRGMAEEIIINLKRVEQDYRINLTKEMEWLRNKVKKGE